ncbi:unnamed protein product [Boreogadus saida]
MGAVRFIREKNCVIVRGPTAPSLADRAGPLLDIRAARRALASGVSSVLVFVPDSAPLPSVSRRFPGLRLMSHRKHCEEDIKPDRRNAITPSSLERRGQLLLQVCGTISPWISPWLHNMGPGSSKSSVAWKCVRLPGGARASDTCRVEGAESAAVFGSGTEPSL